VLEELHGYASLRDPRTGVEVWFLCQHRVPELTYIRSQVGPAERIWKSDKLIPPSLRNKLLAAAIPLEAVPDSEKDWHPGSNGLVLNLVHPSLYPIVYGRTVGKLPSSNAVAILEFPGLEGADPGFVSKRFQWLPSDFSVDGHGKVTLISPYINNIHPTHHKGLYSVIPEILQHALPMFERVLSDLLRPLLPMRVAMPGDHMFGGEDTVGCIWGNRDEYEYRAVPGSNEQYAQYKFRTPNVMKRYGGGLKVMDNRISLKGRILQVIVKLANIVLTPERPEYPGGNWHVEGLLQSHFTQKGQL